MAVDGLHFAKPRLKLTPPFSIAVLSRAYSTIYASARKSPRLS
jgi:hypothetical protein